MRTVRGINTGLLTAVLLLGGCGGESTPSLPESPELATGSLTGFLSPIDTPNAEVILFDETREVARATYSNGVFLFKAVPPGTYRMEVRAAGYQVNDAAKGIRISPGEVVDIGRIIMIGAVDDASETPYVEGVVLHGTTNAPLRDANVHATCPYGVCSVQYATTDEEGKFRLPVPVSFETLVVVTLRGFVGKGVYVQPVERGKTARVTIPLAPLTP